MTHAGELPWQQPNATEAYAAERIASCLPLAHGYGYLPFPWATWIDRQRRGLSPAGAPQQNGIGSLNSTGICATVSQHIWTLEHIELFQAAGITDLFWSHATTGLQWKNGIRIHPFPLYPVRCITHPLRTKRMSPWQRPLLYSFQGAYERNLYRTPVREWILHWAARSDTCLERRSEWHYEQAVYHQQVLGQAPQATRIAQLAAEASSYAHTLQTSCFALCPSGSGPNSIRLWEALGYGAIPVILSDQLQLPGDSELWCQAALFVPETESAVDALPSQLEALFMEHSRLTAMQTAGQQLWQRYGWGAFVSDLLDLLHDPHRVLRERTLRRLPEDPLIIEARRSADLPLQVWRFLRAEKPMRPVLIQILDEGPPALLQLRWQLAIKISAQLLEGRPWAVSSICPQLESLNLAH